MRKIGVIGCGMVGMSYVYAMIQKEVDLEMTLIDMNKEAVEANVMDVEDALPLLTAKIRVKVGDYKDLKEAELVVITAGRPQKPGESRLDMIKDNSLIMKDIAKQVRNSGFAGISIIASNPVDCLTYVYQKESGYERSRVIGSGTVLDSSRLTIALARKLKVSPKEVSAMLIGEHGDSSVFVKSLATVKERSLSELLKEKKLSQADLKKVHDKAVNKAALIIKGKRATYYGIGNALSYLSIAILKNRRIFAPVGVFVKGIHGAPDVAISYPVAISKKGVERIDELHIDKTEQKQFIDSCRTIEQALKEIGY